MSKRKNSISRRSSKSLQRSSSMTVDNNFLEMLKDGYILCRKSTLGGIESYYAAASNRKAKEIMRDNNSTFDQMSEYLTEIEEPNRCLHLILKGAFGTDMEKGSTSKLWMNFSCRSQSNSKDPHSQLMKNKSVKKIPLQSYKLQLIKVEKDSILLILSEKRMTKSFVAENEQATILCTLSHELRTLLNGIIGNLDLLDDKIVATGESRLFHQFATCSAGLLDSKINDLIDYIQHYQKRIKLHYWEFSLDEMVEDIITICKGLAQQKQIKFEVEHSKQRLRTMIGDRARIMQITLNLASKAIEFSEYGSHIVLFLKRKMEGKVTFKVRSNGSALAEKMERQIRSASPSSRRARACSFDNPTEATENLEVFFLAHWANYLQINGVFHRNKESSRSLFGNEVYRKRRLPFQ
eukprot:TRINITY_DN42572_c0_g1_i1.p1 TRINITY_DN42572_c0_g1~~TRINITY_DN42572_c0_g1_i1.p1  ORF type:complete len:469 (+),score=64.15 TRINITY_DN42572_c0_g1_i1:186-1409(+)